jgi:hypothetical protein
MVFREQFLPNCDASRFTSKKSRYRRCAPLIRPHVVPLYRRVLAPLAWSMNIPVIPMDHVFRDGYRYCSMMDGIHLDLTCMMTEQQHIWNTVALLRRHAVVQGLGTVHAGLRELPSTRSFLNITRYAEWLTETSMLPPLVGVGVRGRAVAVPLAVAAIAHEDVLDSQMGSPVKEMAHTPIALRVEYVQRPATHSVPRPLHDWSGDHWPMWLLGSAVIVALTVYLSRFVR